MKIKTKYHGETEIKEADVIQFSNGIPGFENERQFTLLAFPDNNVFYALQSVTAPDVSFVVTDPFAFFPDYDVHLDEAVVDSLAIEQTEGVMLVTILTVRDPFEQTTANLQAPVVINKKTNKGRQIILTGTPYATRHELFSAAAAKGE